MLEKTWKWGCACILQEAVPEDAMKDELMDSLSKGNFTMRILYEQLANIQKMGPVGQVMGMIPGLSNSGLFTKVRVLGSPHVRMQGMCSEAVRTCVKKVVGEAELHMSGSMLVECLLPSRAADCS